MWGKEEAKVMEFSDLEHFYKFLDNILFANAEVLEEVKYNDLDELS